MKGRARGKAGGCRRRAGLATRPGEPPGSRWGCAQGRPARPGIPPAPRAVRRRTGPGTGCGHQARPARPLAPGRREILDDLTRRPVKLSLGGSVHAHRSGRPTAIQRPRHRRRLRSRPHPTAHARSRQAKRRLRGKQPKLNPRREAHLVALHRAGRTQRRRTRRPLRRRALDRLPGDRARPATRSHNEVTGAPRSRWRIDYCGAVAHPLAEVSWSPRPDRRGAGRVGAVLSRCVIRTVCARARRLPPACRPAAPARSPGGRLAARDR